MGHVGTDDVFWAGNAGPHPVRVTVRQPGVIPGLADITIRVPEGDVDRVLVTALRRVGEVGEAPPPDVAEPVAGATDLYSAQLWLMVRGTHSVLVTVEGAHGSGTAVVPVIARATARLEMGPGLAAVLIVGGVVLVLGLLTLVGAAVRESVLPAGAAPDSGRRRRAGWATAATAVVVSALLFGGWTWWGAEDALYEARLSRPWSAEAQVRESMEGPVLEFRITEPVWVRLNDSTFLADNPRATRPELMPDHGKLMHMFLVEDGTPPRGFAHVHPVPEDPTRFRLPLPPLPAGTYRVYADIIHDTGNDRTLQATLALPEERAAHADSAAPARDPDDAWWTSPNAGLATDEVRLEDGTTVRWERGEPLVEDADGELAFAVLGPDGAPALLEPYMGMGGHAMVHRSDGSVFLHLHPSGSVPMASQTFVERQVRDAASAEEPAMAHASMVGVDAGRVSFPVVFPSSGDYQIWVQVRVGEDVRTVGFRTTVAAAS